MYALGAASVPFAEYAVDWFAPTPLALESLSTTLPPTFFPLFGAFAVCGSADSIRLPASMALFVEEGEHFDAVAGSLSLRSISWKVGQILGPVTVGAIWDFTSVFVAFWVAAAMTVLSALTFAATYGLEPAPDAAAVPADD